MTAYYNENDPYAAQWLRNLIARGLIAPGDVDDRDIQDVRPGDLKSFTQCHWFAGIAGWSLALRMAGWPDGRPVWTGSCPCQPFSQAGQRKGFDDARHLWPVWSRLISERRPATIFGEQVARASAWLALVRGDLEEMGYAVGCMPIEAASVGARHLRDRYWFVAQSDGSRAPARQPATSAARYGRPIGAEGGSVPDPAQRRWGGRPTQEQGSGSGERPQEAGGPLHGRGESQSSGLERGERNPWLVEPDVGRVVDGIPARVGKLRALGNAIVPQAAAEFIGAYLDAVGRDFLT